MTSLKKNISPNQKCIFIANQKTCWVFSAFEQLSTTFNDRVALAHSHMRSGCFGAKSSKQAGYESVLTRLLLVYEYFIPKNPVWAAIFTSLHNSITHQSIVLSCRPPGGDQSTVLYIFSHKHPTFIGTSFMAMLATTNAWLIWQSLHNSLCLLYTITLNRLVALFMPQLLRYQWIPLQGVAVCTFVQERPCIESAAGSYVAITTPEKGRPYVALSLSFIQSEHFWTLSATTSQPPRV